MTTIKRSVVPYTSIPRVSLKGMDGRRYVLPTAGGSWDCHFFDDTAISMGLYPQEDIRLQNFLFAVSMIGRKRDPATGEYKGKPPHEVSQNGDSPVWQDGLHTMYAREDTPFMFLEEAAHIYRYDPNLIKSLKPIIRDVIDYMISRLDDYGIPWMREPCALPRVDIKDSGFFGECEGTPNEYTLLMWIGGLSRALKNIAPVVRDIGLKDPDYKTLMELHEKTQKAMHEHFRYNGHVAIGIGDGKLVTGLASDYLESLQYFDELSDDERQIARKYAQLLANPFGFASYAREQNGYNPLGYQEGSTWPVMNGFIMKGAEIHSLPDISNHARNGLIRIDVLWPGVYPEYLIVARREDVSRDVIEEIDMQQLGDYVFQKAGSDHQMFAEAAIRRAYLDPVR